MVKRLVYLFLKFAVLPLVTGLYLFAAPLLMLWGLSWVGLELEWTSWKLYAGVMIVWTAILLTSFLGAQVAQTDVVDTIGKVKKWP